MTIISISVPDNFVDDIKKLREQEGFSGRSSLIRAALTSLLSESKEKQILKGKGIVSAVLVVLHDTHQTESISLLTHKYQHLIQTQLHNHGENHTCLELYMLKGAAHQIKALYDSLKTKKKIGLVKLVVY